jgi:hypothetical protein
MRNGRNVFSQVIGEEQGEEGCAPSSGEAGGLLFSSNTSLTYIKDSGAARDAFRAGIAAGTAWLFSRPEWEGVLDFLFIDEAGQVPLANTVAMARTAQNLVVLGDQMQLEQPVQGSHPGDSGLSALQYALKDQAASSPDAPVFHAVVPPEGGLFLGESRRMHPDVCRFISESIYEGRLGSHGDCDRQKIAVPAEGATIITRESGIVFSGIQHDGNIQQSDEEVERVRNAAGPQIRKLRTHQNLSQDALAAKLQLAGLDLDRISVAKIEMQIRSVFDFELAVIADVLQVTTDDLRMPRVRLKKLLPALVEGKK